MPAAGWVKPEARQPLADDRSALAATCAPLALWVARRMARRAPRRLDDYRDAATDAILDAARDFDPSRGTFATLAREYAFRAVRDRAKYLGRACRSGPAPIRLSEAAAPAVMPRLPDLAPDFAGLIAGLPPDLREVIRLRHAEGLKQREVAGRIGRSTRTVREIEHKALEILRAAS